MIPPIRLKGSACKTKEYDPIDNGDQLDSRSIYGDFSPNRQHENRRENRIGSG